MRLVLLIMMFFNFGCMEEMLEDEVNNAEIPEIGMMNYSIDTLDSNELNLARSLCASLSEKEETFPRRYFGSTISFKVKQRECSEDKSELKEAVIKARLGSDTRSGTMRYFPMDFYLPLMTDIETVNQGVFSKFCPDLLLNVQKTNSVELDDGNIQVFRFLADGSDQIMAQVLTSAEPETEVSRIQELSVVVNGGETRPRGLVARKIDLVRCGNLEGNENASFWSQEI